MRRWSDNDHTFGPFLYCRDKYRNLALILNSGDDDEYAGCSLRLSLLGHTFIASLPPIIRPWKQRIIATTWDDATIARMGRSWYYDSGEREYGFSYGGSGSMGGGGFLQVFLGRQTDDSGTEQRWSCFTPWNNWRHVRHSLYGLDGNLFATEPKREHSLGTEVGRDQYERWRQREESCPSRTFQFIDFDGEKLSAKTRIEERQWELGTGWFKWLSKFYGPIIHRSLDIQFSGETGKKKGSWKGGTLGHSIEMAQGELHESAFRRYCIEHDMKFEGELVCQQV